MARFTLEINDDVLKAVDKEVAAMDGLFRTRSAYIEFALALLVGAPIVADFDTMLERIRVRRTQLRGSRRVAKNQ